MQLCIGLCVYNNEFGLPYIFKNIERIQTLFEKKIQIIVAYDESYDCSLGILLSTLKTFNVHILKNSNSTVKIRVDKICNARNQVLDYIRNWFPESSYMIMMDTNEYACVGDICVDLLKEAFEREKEWDAISFDREAGYYDYLALSFDPIEYSFLHTTEYSNTDMKQNFKIILENAKKTPDKLIPVFSAFNGFSIYKWSVFKICKYKIDIDLSLFSGEFLGNRFNGDCEHRHFHLQAILEKNARIRIFPKFLFALFKGEKIKNCRGPC